MNAKEIVTADTGHCQTAESKEEKNCKSGVSLA